ncbi:MAG: antitoxin family protein [Gemmataceae bacterium]|nr:antitoxin family protein [Gemmataceae bacterium]
MTRSLQAVFEKGVLRPLEPLPLQEHQQVTVTVSLQADGDWLDAAFLRYLETQADDGVSLEEVRAALAKIPGSMAEDFHKERNDRF